MLHWIIIISLLVFMSWCWIKYVLSVSNDILALSKKVKELEKRIKELENDAAGHY